MARPAKRVMAWVWPPACPVCAARLPWESGVSLCADCWRALPWWRTDEVLVPELKGIGDFKAAFLYEGAAREMILKLKFGDGLYLARLLAGWIAADVAATEGALVVPVPSHVSRLRWRGYSHTALLVKEVARRVRCEVSLSALVRVTKSDGQVTRTRKQRLRLRGVDFSADTKQVAGREIVLVDDIVTTGGTVMACAVALRRAGAKSVRVVAVAYTPPGREMR